MIRSLDPNSKQEEKNPDWDSRILESLYDSRKKLQKINFSSPKKLIRTKYSIFKVYNQREENNSFFMKKWKNFENLLSWGVQIETVVSFIIKDWKTKRTRPQINTNFFSDGSKYFDFHSFFHISSMNITCMSCKSAPNY